MTMRSARPGNGRARFQSTGCTSVQDILNLSATAEAFAVTALGGAIENAAAGLLAINAEAIGALVAARAEEQAHLDFLTEAGAVPVTTIFTIPDPAILTDPATFYETVITLEEAFVGHYLAVAQELAAQGERELAQVALQIGAVEAEHRVGLRFFAIVDGVLDDPVPNDVAFEKSLFNSATSAADLLGELGFIGGDGTEVEYPGPGTIDATGVNNLQP